MSALILSSPRDPADDAARCAWLLSVDMAQQAVSGPGFARIYSVPGKVGRGSDARTALARKLACYLAVAEAGVSIAVLARAAGLDRKTVTLHVQAVEDMRENGGFDAEIGHLGRRMIGAAARMVLMNLGEAA